MCTRVCACARVCARDRDGSDNMESHLAGCRALCLSLREPLSLLHTEGLHHKLNLSQRLTGLITSHKRSPGPTPAWRLTAPHTWGAARHGDNQPRAPLSTLSSTRLRSPTRNPTSRSPAPTREGGDSGGGICPLRARPHVRVHLPRPCEDLLLAPASPEVTSQRRSPGSGLGRHGGCWIDEQPVGHMPCPNDDNDNDPHVRASGSRPPQHV